MASRLPAFAVHTLPSPIASASGRSPTVTDSVVSPVENLVRFAELRRG